MKKYLIFLGVYLCLATTSIVACSSKDEMPSGTDTPEQPDVPTPDPDPEFEEIPLSSLEIHNVFTAGEAGINTYRIPALVATPKGTLLLFCEARKQSWRDHQATAVVVKRSTDGGKTWSEIIDVANDNFTGAYADPCPVVDALTGDIYVMMAYFWEQAYNDGTKNKAYLVKSTDDGLSWSEPEDVSKTMVCKGFALQGVGVGSGIQIKNGKYRDRLIIPTRQVNMSDRHIENHTVYSDDHGKTWQIGSAVKPSGEHEIVEISGDRLLMNSRYKNNRWSAISPDGGQTWSELQEEGTLPTLERGCQGSILSDTQDVVLYSGPRGGSYSETIDDRCGLTLFRSLDGGSTWSQEQEIYKNASGYSSLAKLPDGRVCIAYEAGDSYGFIRTHAPRPSGWMRLDVFVIPEEVLNPEYWFISK